MLQFARSPDILGEPLQASLMPGPVKCCHHGTSSPSFCRDCALSVPRSSRVACSDAVVSLNQASGLSKGKGRAVGSVGSPGPGICGWDDGWNSTQPPCGVRWAATAAGSLPAFACKIMSGERFLDVRVLCCCTHDRHLGQFEDKP